MYPQLRLKHPEEEDTRPAAEDQSLQEMVLQWLKEKKTATFFGNFASSCNIIKEKKITWDFSVSQGSNV